MKAIGSHFRPLVGTAVVAVLLSLTVGAEAKGGKGDGGGGGGGSNNYGTVIHDIAKLNEYLRSQGLLGDVYFDYDRAELREDARERLTKNAEWLRSHSQFEVTIEGHCDERGTNEYNLALGERRAGAARDYMTSLGVNVARLRSISYGEERPQCTASAESCWAMNRRAHFIVTGRGNAG